MANCSDMKDRVGDNGQRFEIRFFLTIYDTITNPKTEIRTAGEQKVFGWAGSLEGAENMRDACKLAPWCFEAWIYDRHTGEDLER